MSSEQSPAITFYTEAVAHSEVLMPITRCIYVSLPADPHLAPNINQLKWGIVEEIEKLGYTPEIFTNPQGKPGLASPKSWNPRDADEIARRCVGAAVLGCRAGPFRMETGSPCCCQLNSTITKAPWRERSAYQHWC